MNLKGRRGYGALHDAVYKRSSDIVKLLVDHASTDVNLKLNKDELTALQMTVDRNDLSLVQVHCIVQRSTFLRTAEQGAHLCISPRSRAPWTS